ncbi:uncharacterized protein LOC143212908 [Lasioglossum baleicum]|uniref:uncharacterized protein LOC143212908 n=1 Tax=Lasioglossum baleicum TaxID=434251 RepID=UPI003FCC323E
MGPSSSSEGNFPREFPRKETLLWEEPFRLSQSSCLLAQRLTTHNAIFQARRTASVSSSSSLVLVADKNGRIGLLLFSNLAYLTDQKTPEVEIVTDRPSGDGGEERVGTT